MSAILALAARPRRSLIILGILALALVAGVLLWPQDSALSESAVREEWVARYDGPASGGDGAYALTQDGAGNVYITGSSYGSGTGPDYATVKYGPDGSEEWVARYEGAGSDLAYALTVDRAGNVYVTGRSERAGTAWDYLTIKYDATGSEEWLRRYDGPGNGFDQPHGIALDASGNIYVGGTSEGEGGGRGYAVVKYAPDGNRLWVARYEATSPEGGLAMAVDSDGNVYMTGGSEPNTATTIKYGADGNELWADHLSDARGFAIAADEAGNSYVAAIRFVGSDRDYVTVKYDGEGSREWLATYDGSAWSDVPTAIAVDSSGFVYVTGTVNATFDGDYATVKYAPDGTELWVARYDGPANGIDRTCSGFVNAQEPGCSFGLAVDLAGNVYVTGTSHGGPDTNADYATVKYAPDGTELWVARYDAGSARALAVDGAGNVYVTGGSQGDYATIKYSQPAPPTPTPVGGTGFAPEVAGALPAAEALPAAGVGAEGSGGSSRAGWGIAAIAGAVALGGAAWFARRRSAR